MQIREKKKLIQIIVEQGILLNSTCGGNKNCKRCRRTRVKLISGTWNVMGKTVEAPADAPACHTYLLSETGEIKIPASSIVVRNGKVASEWRTKSFPQCVDTVIGLDIGTTTIAAVKIKNAKISARASCFNPQIRFGDNVVSRINYASTGGLARLQQVVLDSIKELIEQLDADDVKRIAVAGNTVMTCLFHGIDPTSIGVMPFTPPIRFFPVRTDLFGEIPVFTVPAISGYVGGDITAGFAETQLKPGEMLVDIGTNCEIIFNTHGEILCTAAAAGPAFEGAGIECGCLAGDGVIDHYFGKGKFSILGNLPPKGLCGSAMLDFLAVGRKLGYLNEFGRIQPKADFFKITDGISIYEWDIEQLLKAKAAVWAGIKTLEDHCKTMSKKIYLAGGFSQFLNLENAIAIGMLPERQYEIVGNTSLSGAVRLACESEFAATLERLADIPREVPLNTFPDFENNFIDGLLLP
jgi:uncharacterized 2Fe-2S/4Fe-4S cluster protein (DUF4445 family)